MPLVIHINADSNMKISGSMIQAYIICPRQAWLMSRNISGNQYNEFIAIGRLLSEVSYNRDKKEIEIDNNKIDLIRGKNGTITLIETKKSSRMIESGKMQLIYYMYNLHNKFQEIKGEIRIPKEKQVIQVELTEETVSQVEAIIESLEKILLEELPPQKQRNKFCNNCSYLDFCWA